MRSLLVLMVAGALLAGCLDEASPDDVTIPEEDVVKTITSWSNETLEGAITAVNAVAGGANVGGVLLGQQGVFEFSVPAETTNLTLHFTGSSMLPGTEAEILLGDPACGGDYLAGCEERYATEGLEAHIEVEGPQKGGWTLRVFLDTPGADQVEFEVEVGRLIETTCVAGEEAGAAAGSEGGAGNGTADDGEASMEDALAPCPADEEDAAADEDADEDDGQARA